jgi:hypothetical protein
VTVADPTATLVTCGCGAGVIAPAGDEDACKRTVTFVVSLLVSVTASP